MNNEIYAEFEALKVRMNQIGDQIAAANRYAEIEYGRGFENGKSYIPPRIKELEAEVERLKGSRAHTVCNAEISRLKAALEKTTDALEMKCAEAEESNGAARVLEKLRAAMEVALRDSLVTL
jgi:hypothetical protein